jgi:uncharacterized repeat protein (TIGR02059 family)
LTLFALAVLLSKQDSFAQSPPTIDNAYIAGARLTITFSEPLTATSSAVASDFTVKLGGIALSVTAMTVAGTDVTLTLAAAVPDADCTDESVTVSFSATGSTMTGTNGGAVRPFVDHFVANRSDDAPQIVSLETDPSGRYIYVTFCEDITDISYQWSDFSAFSVSVDGDARSVNDLLRRSDSPARLDVDLGRASPIDEGETVTIAYDQDLGDDIYPLQDMDQGNKLVASWSERSVTNNVDGPPTLVSVLALYEIVTLTFSEALDEGSVPEPEAFSFSGIPDTPQVSEVSVSGDRARLTLTDILHNRGSPQYSFSYLEPNDSPLRQLDGAHHVADISSFQFKSGTPDTNPIVKEANVLGPTLTLSFDLPLKAVAPASAFTVSGQDGITVIASSFTGSVVTLTLSPAVRAGSVISVSYTVPDNPPKIEGRNTRDAEAFSNVAVTNNTTAVAPEFQTASVSADGSALHVTFSVDLDSSGDGLPDATAFSLSGTSATTDSVSVDGSVVELSLMPLADFGETIALGYSPPSSQTAPRLRSRTHGQPVEAFADQAVTNNADGKPRAQSATVLRDTVAINFDRALDSQSVPALSSFSISGVSATVSDVAIDGTVVRLTISSPVTHLDMVALGYTRPSETPLKHEGSVRLVDSFSGLSASNLTEDPTPQFVSASVDASGRTLTIVMSQALLESVGGIPAQAAFTLSGTSQAAIASVAVEGRHVTMRLDPAADLNHTLTLGYQAPSNSSAAALRSADGKWQATSWTEGSVANRSDGVPRLFKATANADSIVLSFDRALDESLIPPLRDFAITPSGKSLSAVTVDGGTVTLTLAEALRYDEVATVSYLAAGPVRLQRNGLALQVNAFSDITVENLTPEPLLRSIVGDGQRIELTFSRILDTSSTPDSSAFSLGPGQPMVTTVTVSDRTVRLDLDHSLTEGGRYTLTYQAPSESALSTTDGSEVPSFAESVINNTDFPPTALSATGDGSSIAISFDQELDSGSAPLPDAFVVMAEDAVAVLTVTPGEQLLSLSLSRALREGELASISYTPPSEAGIADLSGNPTEMFTLTIDNQTDTAPVPVIGTANADVIVIVLDQDIYEDPRFLPEEEDAGDSVLLDHFTLTGVEAAILGVHVSNEGPGGAGRIEIVLSPPIAEGEELSISYFPNTGNIPIRDNDAGQNRAQINDYPLQNLTDDAPVIVSGTANGETVVVTFDQALNPDSRPAVTAFELGVAGPKITAVAIAEELLTLTLSSTVVEDAEYVLTYVPPMTGGLSDTTGHPVEGFRHALENTTDYAPFPIDVTATEEFKILLRFDQRLDPLSILYSRWFSLGPLIEIDQVIHDPADAMGKSLLIRPHQNTPIREGTELQLTYVPPMSGGLRDDDAGNQVAQFTQKVTNKVDVAPLLEGVTVNRMEIRLEFDQPLDPERVPPGNCEALETQPDIDACREDGDIKWFEVFRGEKESLDVVSVGVADTAVILDLANPVGRNDQISVSYSPQSLHDGQLNLRDTSSPANLVQGIDLTLAMNLTPAAAVGTVFDRGQPDRISVKFDSDLASDAGDGISQIQVTVDGAPTSIMSAQTTGSEMSLVLSETVPECVPVALRYDPGDSPLLDIDGREIVAFSFDIANLIDSSWGLKCVHSDFGALLLTFTQPDALDIQGFEWQVSVNDEVRTLVTASADGVVHLYPASSICTGDFALVKYSSAEATQFLVLQREVINAAPCAISALADGTRLVVTFDEVLDDVAPDISQFSVSGHAEIEAVESVNQRTLLLRLSSPGLRTDEPAALTYSGASLSGGGLTVGPFSLPIRDTTAAPDLVSGYAFGSSIFLKFDQPLLSREIPASRFIPTGSGFDQTVKSVSLGGASVHLELSHSLPDDPDLLGLIYLARERGGLAGLTGARVGNSIFLVHNYTETPPTVRSAVANSRSVVVTFDQPVDSNGALPVDFSIMAGHRQIPAVSLEWTKTTVALELAERVTSLDAVRLRYTPGEHRGVRDTSNIALAELEFWADNQTARPSTIDGRIDDAKLRASAGATTLQRELARGFASDDGIRFSLGSGEGRATVVRGGLNVSINARRTAEGAAQINVVHINHLTRMLEHFAPIPSTCWSHADRSRSSAWWLGQSDRHGLPTDLRVRFALTGTFTSVPKGSLCVFDLITAEWRLHPRGSEITGPALLLLRETPPALSWDPWPLAG